ncbi:MAG: sensor histidine kinase, partial [Planctomycetota bacterium]
EAAELLALEQLCQRVDLPYILNDLDKIIEDSIEGTVRIEKIVGDLKDFAHIDEPELTDVDLNKVIEQVINVAWNELKYRAVIVRHSQVFLNLLLNAVQAFEEKGTITVTTHVEEETLLATVTDDGKGIPTTALPRIFDPFYTTKPVGQGTGLGLNISYNIVKAHGGEISVESSVGQGTTFTVCLPLRPPTMCHIESEPEQTTP